MPNHAEGVQAIELDVRKLEPQQASVHLGFVQHFAHTFSRLPRADKFLHGGRPLQLDALDQLFVRGVESGGNVSTGRSIILLLLSFLVILGSRDGGFIFTWASAL